MKIVRPRKNLTWKGLWPWNLTRIGKVNVWFVWWKNLLYYSIRNELLCTLGGSKARTSPIPFFNIRRFSAFSKGKIFHSLVNLVQRQPLPLFSLSCQLDHVISWGLLASSLKDQAKHTLRSVPAWTQQSQSTTDSCVINAEKAADNYLWDDQAIRPNYPLSLCHRTRKKKGLWLASQPT